MSHKKFTHARKLIYYFFLMTKKIVTNVSGENQQAQQQQQPIKSDSKLRQNQQQPNDQHKNQDEITLSTPVLPNQENQKQQELNQQQNNQIPKPTQPTPSISVVQATQPAAIEPPVDTEAEAEYTIGMSKMNASQSNDRDYASAYVHLTKAAARNHTKAMEEIGIAHVFGDYLQRNLTEAKRIFEYLSTEHGMPRSQFYLGFMHATGLGFRTSNQGKALVYLTFAALGGDSMGQMAMGYRHWSGISVVSSCEMALSYYKKVTSLIFLAVIS